MAGLLELVRYKNLIHRMGRHIPEVSGYEKMFSLICCAVLAQISTLVVAVNEPSYLVTAPNRFIQNRPETVCIDLYNVVDPTDVQLTLSTVWVYRSWSTFPPGAENKTVATASTIIFPGETSKCVTMTLPSHDTDSGPDQLKLEVVGRPANGNPRGFEFRDTVPIAALGRWYNTDIVFIQTDKPIYKPGQLVRIRILSLDTRLRPSNSMIEQVTIETPGRIRVEQWNNLTVTKGMVQLEFQLHEEPEMGFYQIKIKRDGKDNSARFEVKEYVLPKYEVTLTPPKYITFQTERVVAKVCAKYTFGQPVLGTVEGSVCVKEQQRFFHHRRGFDGAPGSDLSPQANSYCTLINNPLVDGCYTIDVSKADVGYDRYSTFQYGVRLEIEARVKEQGTGTYLNATTQTLYFQRYDIQLNIEGPRKFKPGLSYNAKVTAERLDGTPAIGEPIDIIINNWGRGGRYSKSYVSDANGEVKFSIPPAAQDLARYSIQARASAYNSSFWSWNFPSAYLSVEGWYSPTGSFLQIVPNTETLTCGSQATFKVQYTTSIALDTQLKYKVVGLTDIADYGSIPVSLNLNIAVTEPDAADTWDHTPRDRCWYHWWWRGCYDGTPNGEITTTTVAPTTTTPSIPRVVATHKGTLTLSVPITAAMSTSGRLVVYYSRPDGEVVADGITFKVEECTDNAASMTFSKSEARPGEPVDISFSASPNSLCSYGIVDKSVFLEGGDNQLSLFSALSRIQNLALREWSGVYVSSRDRCGPVPKNDTHYFYWTVPYQDASEGFRDAGLAAATNLDIHTSPCKLNSYRRFRPSARFAAAPGQDGAPGAPGVDGAAGPEGESRSFSADNSGAENSKVTQTVRTFFPETWLWDLVDVDVTGSAVVPATVPDTITEWVGNAVCMDEQDGLGVSAPASLIGFQPFFVSMNLPYSVIRAERVPIAVTVSNYLSKCMAVNLRINPTPDYEIRGSSSAVTCVCGQNTATNKFTIVMREIGDVNVSITAEVVNNPSACPVGSAMASLVGMSDTVIRPVIVEPEGTPREYTISDFVCMTNPQSNLPRGNAEASYELLLPPTAELIPGSERAYVKAVGDVMGPAMSNIGSLLRMPYGCAEQTMVSFAPNIFALKYLEAINKDNPELRAKAIRYMKSGYQRELTYAHADQSYSSFGRNRPSTPGSMWLTAFVVKCFGLAQPYIFIDKSILSKSIEFFINNQDREGCFPQIGTVHNKYMQGGFGRTSNGTNKAALTAFVAIAMMESGVEPTDPSISAAFQCIDRQEYDDGYTTSIVAYAYSLYDRNDRRVYNKLISMAKVNGTLTMWKANENVPEVTRNRWWYYRPRSADTETTAYALLTILNLESDRNNKIRQGLPVVRWLSTQRNPWGGFGSTQDTVIGLQALAEYAALIYSDGISASIRIREQDTNTQVATFEINNVNSFVEFTERIPRVTNLALSASGTGCFLMQANVRYNINKQDRYGQPFTTSARVYRRRGSKEGCKNRQLRICTRYTGEGGVSNMAIVEVKMISGWAVDKSTLKDLIKDTSVELQRYEVDKDGAVQLYFNSLDRNQKCFTLDINQEFDVKDAKPAVVTTYDYYKTELRQEVEYRIYECTRRVQSSTMPPIFFF